MHVFNWSEKYLKYDERLIEGQYMFQLSESLKFMLLLELPVYTIVSYSNQFTHDMSLYGISDILMTQHSLVNNQFETAQ